MIEKMEQVSGDGTAEVRRGAAVVELRNVFKSYETSAGSVPVLTGVNIEISAGETVVVRGVSGSGKSTLLHVLGAIDTASSGLVRVCGVDLSKLSKRDQAAFRARCVGFVFQFFNLIPTLSALENIVSGLEPLPDLRGRRNELAVEFLHAVGLADQAEKYPSQMSGGQQQRVAIARAVAKRPAIVLADEPTGALDSATAGTVLELLQRIKRETGSAIVIATHDPLAARHADRIVQFRNGALVAARE